jgi:hypothetical protein
MFDVNRKPALTRLSRPATALVLPALVLAGCIDEADTFKSKPDAPPDAGVAARTSSSASATSNEEQRTDDGGAPPRGSSEVATSAHSASSTEVTRDGQGVTSGAAGFDSSNDLEAGQDAGDPTEGIPPGSVVPELVGIWQQTRTSSAAYEGEFGETFSDLSSFSVQLKINAEGQYSFAHSTSGSSGDCALVTRLDESVGTATLDGNVLTLQPVARNIDISDCDSNYSDDTNLEPILLTIRLSEGNETHGGMRTFVMSAEGYGFPLSLTSLFRQPTYVPEQPVQPEEFVLGVNGPFADLQGQWLASATGTDSSFYNPDTGEFYFPELNGSPHRWLRFEGGEYETAVALQDVSGEGACKLDLIYYERGAAAFEVLEDVEGLGSHFVGHAALVASDSRLIVNVRDCDEDDGAVRYDLEPLTSYFRWIYFSTDRPPESFTWACDFELSEWQSLLCDEDTAGFVRPE